MFAAIDPMVREAGASVERKRPAGLADWDSLDEPSQLSLAGAALRRAAAAITFQAEMLAREMEAGGLPDRGGPEALRLLANLARATAEDGLGCLPGE